MSRVLVFAYGSNMDPERMQARIRGALPGGRARLSGHRLVMNKRGRDGSAKANLAADAQGLVWGVLWELSAGQLAVLDRHEGDYERVTVSVQAGAGAVASAETYVSARLVADALPYDWYLGHIVRGARAHGLPEPYVAWLASLPSQRAEP
jgi:hypothetical protein